MTHEEEKNQLIETDPELTWMLELTYKDIERVILTIFHEFKKLSKRCIFKKHPNKISRHKNYNA